jgi:ketosteroid isomerase-like protein
MYKAAVRTMIRHTIRRLNDGDYGPALRMFADDATLSFPGSNTWSHQFRAAELGCDAVVTHRGRAELEAFLQRYIAQGIEMVVEDILVNGPPWNMRAAARVHHSILDADGTQVYANRAVLFVNARWGKIRAQEDYEDTTRVAAFDELVAAAAPAG